MTVTASEFAQLLSENEQRTGLPSGILSSIFIQETGGKLEYLDDPTKPHYPTGVAKHSGAKSSAYGPFGITNSTARDPGWITPLRNKNDIKEQTRFAADYLAARIKHSGSIKAGVAGYGEGDSYADKVLGRLSEAKSSYVAQSSGVKSRAAEVNNNPTEQILAGTKPANPVETQSTVTKNAAELLIDELVRENKALGQAKADAVIATGDRDIATINETNKLLSQLGLNINDTESALATTAAAMQKSIATVNATRAQKEKESQDPFFNVVNIWTGGKLSRVQDNRLKAATDDLAAYADALTKMQAVARTQIQLNPTATASAVAQEVRAKAQVELAAASSNAAKLGLEAQIKQDALESRQAIADANREAQNSRAETNRVLRERELEIRENARNNPVQSEVRKQQESDAKASAEIVRQQSVRLGLSEEQFRMFRSTNPEVARDLTSPDAPISPQLANALDRAGLMKPEVRKLYVQARSQWTSPTHSSNNNTILGGKYLAQAKPALDQAEKYPAGDRESARMSANRELAVAKLANIVNDGKPETFDINPYAANFPRLEAMVKMDEFSKANPVVAKAVNSELYQGLKAKNAGNSGDKAYIGDEEVLMYAGELFRAKKLTNEQVVQQVVDYFEAHRVSNNYTFQFSKIGMPMQDSYRVPVVNSGTSLKIDLAEKEGESDYRPMDLTKVSDARLAILRGLVSNSEVPPWLFAASPLAGVIGAVRGKLDKLNVEKSFDAKDATK